MTNDNEKYGLAVWHYTAQDKPPENTGLVLGWWNEFEFEAVLYNQDTGDWTDDRGLLCNAPEYWTVITHPVRRSRKEILE